MEEQEYFLFRKIAYWFFVVLFIICAPLIVLYSVGFKFNTSSRKFQRTGAISIQTIPREADVFLNTHKLSVSTPCVLRELIPGKYTVEMEKAGFYTYRMDVDVASSVVSEVDATLVPQARNVEKISSDMDIYRFFVIDHFFGKKIIIFTDKGIFIMDEDLSDPVQVASMSLDISELNTIVGLKNNKNRLAFWNDNSIWIVEINSRFQEEKNIKVPSLIYSTKESIKDVYFGLNRYLIIHDGMNIIAMDIKNPSVVFTLMKLSAVNAKMFYDSSSDVVYVRDRVQGGDKFSLFKLNLREIVHDKGTN